MKKYIITLLIALLAISFRAESQTIQEEVEIPIPDSLVIEVPEIILPSILDSIETQVVASDSLRKAMNIYISKNSARNASVTIYRLRIFFDNTQDARSVSEQIATEFTELYPDVPVFRGYTNPYFKVTVGNYRTKSEALKFLNEIKEKYPSVFLVKEAIGH